jgi:hypothetical protein
MYGLVYSMPDIPEHDPELEWEGYDGEESRVHFSVPRMAVGID